MTGLRLEAVTRFLKTIRGSQPFNRIATSMVRSLLEAAGWRSEFVIKHLHRLGEVAFRLPNGRIARLWSRGDDWVSNQLYWRGWDGYEPETARLFFSLASRARITFDIGAYVGYYAILAGCASPKGSVYAFEPLPAAFERLQHNVRLNRLDNVHAVAAAVGEDVGPRQLYHASSVGLPTSSTVSLGFAPGAAHLGSSTVSMTTVDVFAEEHDLVGVDLVKIDIERAEPMVLRGMAATLARDGPDLICEVLEGLDAGAQLERVLSPLGYRYYLLTPEGPEPKAQIRPHPLWLNYFFTRRPTEEQARSSHPSESGGAHPTLY